MGINKEKTDLDNLSEEIDELLSKETKESLTSYLKSKYSKNNLLKLFVDYIKDNFDVIYKVIVDIIIITLVFTTIFSIINHYEKKIELLEKAYRIKNK